MQALSPNESGVDLVPVKHARLSEFPAVEDIAPVDLPTKIHQPRVHAFADDAEIVQLRDVTLNVPREPLRLDLEEFRNRIGMFGARSHGRELELPDLVLPGFVIAHEVRDDPAYEREGSVGFFDCESSFHDSYSHLLNGVGQGSQDGDAIRAVSTTPLKSVPVCSGWLSLA